MTNLLQLAAGLLFLASGVIRLAGDGPGVLAWLFLAIGAAMLVVFVLVLRRRPHEPYSDELLIPGRGVVLWQQDSPESRALMRHLNTDGRISWVDVGRDPRGAAKVREVMDGALATPLLVTRDRTVPNPSVADVRRALAGR